VGLALQGETTIAVPKEPSAHTRFVSLWTELYAAVTGVPYDWTDKWQFRHVSDLLAKPGGHAEVERRARIYLGPECPAWMAEGRDLKGLMGNWNKLGDARTPGTPTQAARPLVTRSGQAAISPSEMLARGRAQLEQERRQLAEKAGSS